MTSGRKLLKLSIHLKKKFHLIIYSRSCLFAVAGFEAHGVCDIRQNAVGKESESVIIEMNSERVRWCGCGKYWYEEILIWGNTDMRKYTSALYKVQGSRVSDESVSRNSRKVPIIHIDSHREWSFFICIFWYNSVMWLLMTNRKQWITFMGPFLANLRFCDWKRRSLKFKLLSLRV